ncbi:MAG: NAD-dependent DNA ligase LigA [Lachnospiraceae bacterium]|jgi:DNA ligase (NAD+)
MNKTERIKELTELLNRASKAYYAGDSEIMSNMEYDALYDELAVLEAETGIVLANSPTVNVGYEAATFLAKERHDMPQLSLDKTKEASVLADFLKDRTGLLSWKLDGLTVVLTYEDGALSKAVTRGDGEIGEVITANARTFVNLPLNIPFKDKLIIRGEAVIKYSDFERINREIEDAAVRYKNPRNLCSGSVRQLDPAVTAARSVNLFAFSLESAPGADFKNSNREKFEWLKKQGFAVVDYKVVDAETVEAAVREFSREIEDFDVPSDGLVLLMDDIKYGQELGATAKFPRNAIAFKWRDEIARTRLLKVEWSPSRTGLINPVAVFETVELEGTSVSRASLHNLSIIEELQLGIGDEITVYKANMIIPQIAQNLTKRGGLPVPQTCPACGGPTLIKDEQGVRTLTCPNADCPAKKIKAFSNYVSRNCMNIEGVSEETLEKFIARGFISDFSDIYHLDRHREEIISMPGFGEKSYENIIQSIYVSRRSTAARLLCALGIPGVGRANALAICKSFGNDFNRVRSASFEELLATYGVGDIMAKSIIDYFADEANAGVIDRILEKITLEREPVGEERLAGLVFVITGSLSHYPNRDALKAEIEGNGGRVAGSVSSKTSYLINNDINSSSGKNKTAKEIGIPIITEEEYRERFGS